MSKLENFMDKTMISSTELAPVERERDLEVAPPDSVLYFRVFTELLDNELVDTRELANKLDTTPDVIREILSNSKFIQKFHEIKLNLEKIQFDVSVFRELKDIRANADRNSDKIAAIKLMQDMLFPKESKGMTVTVNVDKVLDEIKESR